MTQSSFPCQRKCQRGRGADTHRPLPGELGIRGLQLPKLPSEWPQSAPAPERARRRRHRACGAQSMLQSEARGRASCSLCSHPAAKGTERRETATKGRQLAGPGAAEHRAGPCVRGQGGSGAPSRPLPAPVSLGEALLLLKVHPVPGKSGDVSAWLAGSVGTAAAVAVRSRCGAEGGLWSTDVKRLCLLLTGREVHNDHWNVSEWGKTSQRLPAQLASWADGAL